MPKPVNLPAILKAAGVESQLELLLLNRLERAGLPLGVTQVYGVPGRLFKFDRAWKEQRVAVDVNGGTFVKGAHSTGVGIERDCEKACLAALAGWRYLPVTRKQIESGKAIEWIARALGAEREALVRCDQCGWTCSAWGAYQLGVHQQMAHAP
jgi:hypothetical protein